MEVHAHTHASKKKWTQYFWDFIMLFLAVFCGFLAEYQLEHKIGKDREKAYMKNMLEDLRADTAIYADYIERYSDISRLIDTLMVLMKSPDRRKHISKLAFTARIITAKSKQLILVERTYEEMKSSGYLRLISKRDVAGKVSSYYNSLSEIDTYNNIGVIWSDNYAEAIAKIFDGEALLQIIREKKEVPLTGEALLSEDKMAINELLTSVGYFYGALSLNNNAAIQRNEAAHNLIALIENKYRLKE